MGALYRHRCGACGYDVQVAGGASQGWYARTVTVSCGECQALYDRAVETWSAGFETEGTREPRCPRSGDHAVAEWTAGGPCPRCGTAMDEAEFVAFWD